MGLVTAGLVGLGATAVGGLLNKHKADKDANRQNAFGQQQAQGFQNLMQTGPSDLQRQGQAMLQGQGNPMQVGGPSYNPQLFNAQTSLGQGFNTGQDALMQSLRSDPTAKSSQALQAIVQGQGNPYDTTALFGALNAQDQRNTTNSINQVRAGASGLGERFGSYLARQSGDIREQANEAAAMRNQQIGLQAHQAAQQRLLAAIGAQAGNQQFGAQQQLAAAQQLQQGGLAAGQLGLQGAQANNQAQQQLAALQQNAGIANQQAGLQGQQNQADLLRSLLSAQQNQTQQNTTLQALAAQSGRPVASTGSYGDILSGVGRGLVPIFGTQK